MAAVIWWLYPAYLKVLLEDPVGPLLIFVALALQIIGGLAVLTAVILIQMEKEHDEMTPALIKGRRQ